MNAIFRSDRKKVVRLGFRPTGWGKDRIWLFMVCMGFWLAKECGLWKPSWSTCNQETVSTDFDIAVSLLWACFLGTILRRSFLHENYTLVSSLQLGGSDCSEIGRKAWRNTDQDIGTSFEALRLGQGFAVDFSTIIEEFGKVPYSWIWYDSQYRWSIRSFVRRLRFPLFGKTFPMYWVVRVWRFVINERSWERMS